MIVGTGKSEICKACWQAGNSSRSPRRGLGSKCSLEAEFLCLQGTSVFASEAFNRVDEAHSHY